MDRSIIYATIISIFLTIGASVSICIVMVEELNSNTSLAAKETSRAIDAIISSKVSTLENQMTDMALDRGLVSAVLSGKMDDINIELLRIKELYSQNKSSRVYLPGIGLDTDKMDSNTSYADIHLVNETFKKQVVPSVQGKEKVDRFLSLTKQIVFNDVTIGVLLVHVDDDFIKNALSIADQGFYEIKQGEFVLATQGDESLKDKAVEQVTVKGNGGWSIFYTPKPYSFSNQIQNLLTIDVVFILTCLVLFLGINRWVVLKNKSDVDAIIRATKDLTTGKAAEDYKIKNNHLMPVMAFILQTKRQVTSTRDSDMIKAENQSTSHNADMDSSFNDYNFDE